MADQNTPTSSGVVTVACKLPHGFIIRDMAETINHEPVLGGGQRKFRVFRPVGQKIRIKGPVVPNIYIRLIEVVGGYAITDGVDGAVFARWWDANADSAFITNKLVYGHEDGARVRAWAKDHAHIKSGMEPLDVTMRSKEGKMVFGDPRIVDATSEMFKSGADLNIA